MEKIVEKYFRPKLPHIWCPGCGNGIVTGAIAQAIDKMGLDQDRTVIVSGIGCSSRASGYLDFDTVHSAHGRALPIATGIKLSEPDLNVIVITGDGDCTAIGGNHFIHAARRNINLTVVLFNNNIYGMTGGQYSPLTPVDSKASTAPYGTIERNFDITELAKAAGATFVARTTTFHVKEIVTLLKKAFAHKGFSVVEILSQCPTYFGRKNKMGGAVQMLEWYRDNTAQIGSKKLEENPNLIPRGVFVQKDRPEYCAEYAKIIAKAHKE